MERHIEMSRLLDFYGKFLTPHQHNILDLYYNHDFSLAEIAEQANISRQGVHDVLQRGQALLLSAEKKLGLLNRDRRLRAELDRCEEILGRPRIGEEDRQRLKAHLSAIKQIWEEE